MESRKGHLNMATSESATQPAQARRLEERLARHKAEVARLRAEFGNPQEALFAFTRDRFDFFSFFSDARERHRRRSEGFAGTLPLGAKGTQLHLTKGP